MLPDSRLGLTGRVPGSARFCARIHRRSEVPIESGEVEVNSDRVNPPSIEGSEKQGARRRTIDSFSSVFFCARSRRNLSTITARLSKRRSDSIMRSVFHASLRLESAEVVVVVVVVALRISRAYTLVHLLVLFRRTLVSHSTRNPISSPPALTVRLSDRSRSSSSSAALIFPRVPRGSTCMRARSFHRQRFMPDLCPAIK